jgi:hypothetical protein
MASWQMRAVALYVRATRKKRYATREAGLAFLHSAKGPSDPPAKALGDSRVSTHRVRGRDVHVVRGPGHTASAAGAVVYLHGGAYTNEVVDQQWAFVAALAARTGVEVHVPIYGLAPHHTASEAVDLVAEVVHGLVAQGRSVVLLGDSAGGGLALVDAGRGLASPRPTRELRMPDGAATVGSRCCRRSRRRASPVRLRLGGLHAAAPWRGWCRRMISVCSAVSSTRVDGGPRCRWLEGPRVAAGVLLHLERAGGHAAGVGRLARGEGDTGVLEERDRLGGGGHVRALGDELHAVGDERAWRRSRELVLGGAGQRDVAGHVPDGPADDVRGPARASA